MKKETFLSILVFISILIGFQSCKPEETNQITANKLTLNETKCVITVNQKMTLIPTVDPEGLNVTWESSDNNIATVNENGMVQGIAKGKTTITASVGKLTATCKVTVLDELETFEVQPTDTLFIKTGASGTIRTGKILTTIEPEELIDYLIATIEPENIADITINDDGNIDILAKTDGVATISLTIGQETNTVILKVVDNSTKLDITIFDKPVTRFNAEDIFGDQTVSLSKNYDTILINNWQINKEIASSFVIKSTKLIKAIKFNGDNSIKPIGKYTSIYSFFGYEFIETPKNNTLELLGKGTLNLENVDYMTVTENTHLIINAALNIIAPEADIQSDYGKNIVTIKNANIEMKYLAIDSLFIMNSGTLKLYNPAGEKERPALTLGLKAKIKITKDAILYEGSTPPGEAVDTLSYYKKKNPDQYSYKPYIFIDASSNNDEQDEQDE